MRRCASGWWRRCVADAGLAALRAAPLATPRLHLEPIAARHAEEMFEILQDPRIYDFIPDPMPGSGAALHERYTRLARGTSADGTQRWLNWIVRDARSGQCMGYVQATVLEDASAFFAYVFAPRWWGAGYAAEAARAAMDFLRGAGVAQLLASVDARNDRSIRLLVRLGFAQRRVETEDGDLYFEMPLAAPAHAAAGRH